MNPAALEPSALDRIALEMTSTLALDDVLRSVTEGLVHDLDVALARVWLVEDGGDPVLRLRASSGLSTRIDGTYARVAIGSRKIGRIAETQEPMWTNDAQNDERIPDKAWTRQNGLVSFAGWPLKFRGELVGVLGTFSKHARTDTELTRMALFANQAAIAIQNARLFAAVRAFDERLQAENAYLRSEAAGDAAVDILSRCPGLSGVLASIDKVAPTTTSVLLSGETGTGKELLARAIHEVSPRRGAPLVRVNCAALSPALFESELFGHEKGAFTGAQQKRMGRFELADGGTLFLDEVGEIPIEMQPKLLRVLQEREIERVGSATPIRIDVRVIAATNRDLRAAVAAGRFREDLFYRLAVFPIDVPSLRARIQDVPRLVEGFVHANARRLGKSLVGVTPEAQARLFAHDWPGNVRELANVIERASIVARGSRITEEDLPPLGRAAVASVTLARESTPAQPAVRLEDVERAHIVRTLERCAWVIEGKSGAAAVLGLAPSTLRSRMSQLGVSRQSGKR